MRHPKPVGERIETVNGRPCVIHVYEPKAAKDESVMAARDDSRKPWSRCQQQMHERIGR